MDSQIFVQPPCSCLSELIPYPALCTDSRLSSVEAPGGCSPEIVSSTFSIRVKGRIRVRPIDLEETDSSRGLAILARSTTAYATDPSNMTAERGTTRVTDIFQGCGHTRELTIGARRGPGEDGLHNALVRATWIMGGALSTLAGILLIIMWHEHHTRATWAVAGEFRTRPEIEIFNICQDIHIDRVILTWETNLRTDTKVKLGRSGSTALLDSHATVHVNRNLAASTRHTVTIENLNADTLYTGSIIANDAAGRAPSARETIAEFPTLPAASVRPIPPYDASCGSRRMPPDEREKLRQAIERFVGPFGNITEEQKHELLTTQTDPTQEDRFNERLQMLRNWMKWCENESIEIGAELQKMDQELQKLYYTNRIRAARRMDRTFIMIRECELTSRRPSPEIPDKAIAGKSE